MLPSATGGAEPPAGAGAAAPTAPMQPRFGPPPRLQSPLYDCYPGAHARVCKLRPVDGAFVQVPVWHGPHPIGDLNVIAQVVQWGREDVFQGPAIPAMPPPAGASSNGFATFSFPGYGKCSRCPHHLYIQAPPPGVSMFRVRFTLHHRDIDTPPTLASPR